jgi:hypothetical protein
MAWREKLAGVSQARFMAAITLSLDNLSGCDSFSALANSG